MRFERVWLEGCFEYTPRKKLMHVLLYIQETRLRIAQEGFTYLPAERSSSDEAVVLGPCTFAPRNRQGSPTSQIILTTMLSLGSPLPSAPLHTYGTPS